MGAVVGLVAGLLVVAAGEVAGGGGSALAMGILCGLALLALRARLPARPTPRPPRRRPARQQPFPTYQKIEEHLWLAAESPRLFDHGTRPLLTRTASVLLRDRAGVELTIDPARARALLGEEAWALVDPAHVASDDSHGPGVELDRLETLLTRMEAL
jgi:hypothetical protein